MNWAKLKENKCPKCGELLEWKDFTYGYGYVCKNPDCDFLISEIRFKQLVNKMVEAEIEKHKQPDSYNPENE